MVQKSAPRGVDIIDILFAVAIGAGFEFGLYEMRADIATLRVFESAAQTQQFARLVIAFGVITASWFYYRGSSRDADGYGGGEFVVDVLVYFTYLPLFMFIEHPAAFYATLTAIWTLYAVAWLLSRPRRVATILILHLASIGFFAAVWFTALAVPTMWAETARIVAAALGACIYRVAQFAVAHRQ